MKDFEAAIASLDKKIEMEDLLEDAISMLTKLKEFDFIVDFEQKGANVFITVDEIGTTWDSADFDNYNDKIGMLHSFTMGFYVASCMASEKHQKAVHQYQQKISQLTDICEKKKSLIVVP